jgi:hypothetical protein
VATAEDTYTCTCTGFTSLQLEQMCLRCLDGYAEGLEHVLSGDALAAEMLHVAACLKRIVEDDPLLGEQYVHVGGRLVERN